MKRFWRLSGEQRRVDQAQPAAVATAITLAGRHRAAYRALPTLCIAMGTCALVLSACALQRYDARPMSVAAGAQEFTARSTEDAGLRDFFAANGIDVGTWPLPRWTLRELTLLAFYYHPELDVARAYWHSVRAGANLPPASGVSAIAPGLEFHSRREDNGERVSPWTLSIAFDYAFAGTRKRDAQLAYAQAQARAAQWEVAGAAWRVRSALRERALDYHAALQRERVLRGEHDLRAAVQELLEKRVNAGAASQLELSSVRSAVSDVQAQLAQARSEAAAARVALGTALGLSARRLDKLELELSLFDALPQPAALPAAALQTSALWHRSDIQQALLAYRSDDMLLKVELSKQYPDFIVSPGFSWDQEDNVWQLGWNVGLPVPKANVAAIARARAQRVLQGQRLRALQAKVIGELEQAQINFQGARQAIAASERAVHERRTHAQRIERQFEAGYADKLDMTLGRFELARANTQRVAALIAAQRALGVLEDALQRPLLGAALPRVPQRNPRPTQAER